MEGPFFGTTMLGKVDSSPSKEATKPDKKKESSKQMKTSIREEQKKERAVFERYVFSLLRTEMHKKRPGCADKSSLEGRGEVARGGDRRKRPPTGKKEKERKKRRNTKEKIREEDSIHSGMESSFPCFPAASFPSLCLRFLFSPSLARENPKESPTAQPGLPHVSATR